MRKNRAIPFIIKPKIAFVVDGECEFWYIQMLKRNEKSLNVDLKPEIPQRKKLLDQYTKVIELSKDYDKVFWIIDFDVIISETRKAKKGAETALQEFKRYYIDIEKRFENIFTIVNNPCLEFWILLHYQTTSKYFDNCDSATKELKKHLTNYEKTQSYYTKQDNDIYLKLKPNLIKAISNAKKLKELDFENPHTAISEMQIFYEIEEIESIIKQK